MLPVAHRARNRPRNALKTCILLMCLEKSQDMLRWQCCMLVSKSSFRMQLDFVQRAGSMPPLPSDVGGSIRKERAGGNVTHS